MKLLIVLLLALGLWLQYQLWLAPTGIMQSIQLKNQINGLNAENNEMDDRNAILQADVSALKTGNEAVEERARNELGMIKKGEVFYRIVN